MMPPPMTTTSNLRIAMSAYLRPAARVARDRLTLAAVAQFMHARGGRRGRAVMKQNAADRQRVCPALVESVSGDVMPRCDTLPTRRRLDAKVSTECISRTIRGRHFRYHEV